MTCKFRLAYSGGVGDVFRALADPTRRLILDELSRRDGQALFEITARLVMGHQLTLTRQAISQHLTVLEEAGLVRSTRAGRTKIHHLSTEPLRAIVQRWPVPTRREAPMPIRLSLVSVFVDDQAKALAFYTDVLGFVLKRDLPLGEHRWLTVVGAEQPEGVELLLEPDVHPVAQAYKQGLVEDGIPCAAFAVDDVAVSYAELTERGVRFTQPPTPMGPVVTAILDDTCGNLVQLVSQA